AGQEGPCGPDTEIFVDMTGKCCGAGTSCLPGICDCGRFFEIWNNVFMTYNRIGGQLRSLSKKNVDTGMGVERTLACINRLDSVYDTSSLKPIVTYIVSASKYDIQTIQNNSELTRALRIISDHLRTAAFILGDDKVVTPSNQGQ